MAPHAQSTFGFGWVTRELQQAGGLIPDMSHSRHETSDRGRADRNCGLTAHIQSRTNHLTDGRDSEREDEGLAWPLFHSLAQIAGEMHAACNLGRGNAEIAPPPSVVDGCKSP